MSAENYYELHKYSITDYAFWGDLWGYLNIVYSVPPETVRVHASQTRDSRPERSSR